MFRMEELSDMAASKVAYVFPGQGSQTVGMGLDLYERFPSAKRVFREADEALGFSLSRLCFEGPEEELNQTVHTQPAVMTVSLACLRATDDGNRQFRSVSPTFVAGHSLGEYTALVAAKVLDFGDAIRLVRERGHLMQAAGEINPSGMAAIIGLDEVSVEEVCQETGAQIANVNSSQQIVISGSKNNLLLAMDLARARGAARVVPLRVSGGFHSPLMQPAADRLSRAISSLKFRNPTVPIVVNGTARPVSDAEAIKHELLRQLCNCVYWRQSVEYMVSAGVSTFVEIGPGQVLTGLIKRISRNAAVVNISDAGSLEKARLEDSA